MAPKAAAKRRKVQAPKGPKAKAKRKKSVASWRHGDGKDVNQAVGIYAHQNNDKSWSDRPEQTLR